MTPLLVMPQALQCQGLGVLGLSPGQGWSAGIGSMWGRCARGLTGGGLEAGSQPCPTWMNFCCPQGCWTFLLLCGEEQDSHVGKGQGVRAGQRGAMWVCRAWSHRVRNMGLCSVVHKVMSCGVREGLAPQHHPPGDAQTPPHCAPSPHLFWRSPQPTQGPQRPLPPEQGWPQPARPCRAERALGRFQQEPAQRRRLLHSSGFRNILEPEDSSFSDCIGGEMSAKG